MQAASPSTQIHRIQGAAANGQSNHQEPSCCQLWCFGRRIVSVSNRDALFLSAFAIVGGPVGMFVGGATLYALSGTPSISEGEGMAAGMAAGIAAGIVAGSIAAGIADYVYLKCRHIATSVPQVQLSRIISHAPEAHAPEARAHEAYVPAEIFSPGNNTTFFPYSHELPPYSPECPPPPYSPREVLRE